MPTATILGDTYQTVIMPDGKEWMVSPFIYSGSGVDHSTPMLTATLGRMYTWDEAMALPLMDGWRNPSVAEWDAMLTASGYPLLGGDYPGAGAMKSTDPLAWNSPNTAAANAFGFMAVGGGYEAGGFASVGILANYWTSDSGTSPILARGIAFYHDNNHAEVAENYRTGYHWSVRLVRAPVPSVSHGFIFGGVGLDFGAPPERGYEPKITPSLTWDHLPSGLWVCMDDGAAFDAYDAEITVYVNTEAIAAWEVFYVAHKGDSLTYIAPDGVRPFGPHIPVGSTGVSVKLSAWANGGRVGVTADLWKITISMRYQGGYTPTPDTTVPAFFARKYASPTWYLPSVVHLTDDGRSAVTARGDETQSCQVVVDNLDEAGSAAAVNWALYTRGSSFTYAPPASLLPFGGTKTLDHYTVRLLSWTVQKPNPRRWDMTFDLGLET